jgi:DNA-directed RNA polymerase specialized sigma24 family protein
MGEASRWEVQAGLGESPRSHRETTWLVYAEGHTLAEAPAVLRVPVGTIMSKLFGRAALAKLKWRAWATPVMSDDDAELAALIDN